VIKCNNLNNNNNNNNNILIINNNNQNCFKVIFKKKYLLYPIKILKTCNFKPHSSYKPIYNGKREYNEIDHLFYKNNN